MKETIKVIRLSSLGDVAMTIPVFISFHSHYPDVKIDFISRQKFKPLFSSLDFVNFIELDDKNGQISLYQLIRFAIQQLPSNHEKIIDLHYVIRTKIIQSIWSLFSEKISSIDKGRAEKYALIAQKGQNLSPLKTTIERYRQTFVQNGFDFTIKNDSFLPKSNKVNKKKYWIGLAPFAKFLSKELGLEQMRLLIENLEKINDIEIFIFGHGNREKDLVKTMTYKSKNTSILIDQLNMSEELDMISNLDLMISMDSANGHLAANYGVPVITIWGTTHPYLGFAPFNQPQGNSIMPNKNKFPNLPISIFGKCEDKSYKRAIDSIDIQEIVSKVEHILKEKA